MAEEKKDPRPFGELLLNHRQGGLHDAMTEALADVVAAVKSTGRKGSLSLTITVEPATKHGGNALVVSDNVVAKPPKVAPPSKVYFEDGNGGLVGNDPNQRTFDEAVRDLAADEGKVRDVAASSTESVREV